MGCGVYWTQIRELDRALGSLKRLGLGELSPAVQELTQLRSKVLRQVGLKFPRTVSLLGVLPGFSPGVFKVWHDVESGFMVEARKTANAPPVYHYVSDDVAVRVMNRNVSPELEEFLMTPETYIGE